MSERELRDLWDAVESLREQQSVTNALLAEIRTILNERCEHRGTRLADLEEQVDSIRTRVWWFSGATGALTYVFTKIIPFSLGD